MQISQRRFLPFSRELLGRGCSKREVIIPALAPRVEERHERAGLSYRKD
jgi:hypothetical protein